MNPKHPAASPAAPDRNSPSRSESHLRTVVRLLARSAAREWFEADQLRQQSTQQNVTASGDRPP
ncbi:hypothetical protein [Acetobacter tropicalis]|uniref:hypothetical protein n=1 Tax=Acetobacter tropicalis TaxID=104102 RepID=UPI000A859659|nr:hypothetical protein [Acetobacter tropicalis]